jgi:HD-GYP domain-containing protein (c-di-GMP phosphodiesterase class II)
MKYELNLREVTSALSTSLDYVGVDDNLHGKRVAYLSFLIGIELGFAENELSDIIFEGILHDCGVSSTSIHEYLVSEMDWEHSQDHCLRGEELLNQVSFYKQYASVIRYHHTHIDRFPESIDAYIKLHSNIIYLTDRVDALRAQGKTGVAK